MRPQEGQAGTVWVAEGGVPRAVRVRAGLSDGSVTEVLAGELDAGMEVIVGSERAGAAPRAAAPARPLF